MAIAASKVAGGGSSSAITVCTFPAQTAGTWLVLQVSADDYRVTSGGNRPESSGWTNRIAGQDEIGAYVWTKVADGSETSVSYQIGSNSPSAWQVTAVTGATPTLDNTPAATHTHGGSTTSSGTATPSAGNRYVLACCAAYHSNTSMTGANWSNSYASVGFQAGPTTGNRENVAAAGLPVTNGAATSTTATWLGASQLCSFGTALVFQEASGGSGTTYPVGGTATATTTTSGAVSRLARTLAVAGTAAALTAASGTVARVPRVHDVTGTAAVVSGSTGATTALLPVGGTSAATTGSSGAVTRPARTHTVSGTAAAVTTAAGAVSVLGGPQTYPVAGTARAVTATTLPTLTLLGAISGHADATSSASGAVTALLAASGTTSAASGSSGAVDLKRAPVVHPVSGTAAAVSGSTGAAYVAPDRAFVPTPDRTLTIPAEDRALTVTREDRTLHVPAENRTVEAQ